MTTFMLNKVDKKSMVPGRRYKIKDSDDRNFQASFVKQDEQYSHFNQGVLVYSNGCIIPVSNFIIRNDEILCCEQYLI